MSAEASVGSHAADSAQSANSQPTFHNSDELRNRGLLGSKYVKLNVGGSLHYTTVQTLSKEDSLLRSICNGGTEVSIDSEGKWLCLVDTKRFDWIHLLCCNVLKHVPLMSAFLVWIYFDLIE